MDMRSESRRVTLFAGHYGSGKTNIALNYARWLRRVAPGPVAVADLDIVNPYFRTADFRRLFDERGIEVFAPVYANTNLDIPSLNIPLESLLKIGRDVFKGCPSLSGVTIPKRVMQIAPGAFDGCDLSDVIMQYDHTGRVFARTGNDTLEAGPDNIGLHIRFFNRKRN